MPAWYIMTCSLVVCVTLHEMTSKHVLMLMWPSSWEPQMLLLLLIWI